MNAVQFFLEQYNTVRTTVDELVFAGLSDEQLRQSPGQDQNSLAWLLWHASRWEDFVLTLLDTNHQQVLDQEDWLGRLNQAFTNGIIGNERAHWVEQLCAGRNKAWFLSLVVWHQAEHLLGEALCVRSQAGVALGL